MLVTIRCVRVTWIRTPSLMWSWTVFMPSAQRYACVHHVTAEPFSESLCIQDECPDVFSRLSDGKQDPEVCQLSTGRRTMQFYQT